jgi:hypothetical protein
MKRPAALTLIAAIWVPTVCTEAEPPANPIRTELRIAKSRFKTGEPILVDVYVENVTKRDLTRPQFSPESSIIPLPAFVFVRVVKGDAKGKEFGIPPGLLGDDWKAWYQPARGQAAYSVGDFSLPAGKKVHLLHGDLRLTVARAREHCQRELDQRVLMEGPENASTKKSYQEIVRFADEFLAGGTYDLYVRAYSKSAAVRVRIDKP